MQAYLTRHQMAIDLNRLPMVPGLPEGYLWVPWDARLMDMFTEVHYLSFRASIDAQIFRSFTSRAGCWHIINEIRHRTDFAPEATWLIAGPGGCCATIQCVRNSNFEGNIQNVAVLPSFRRLGLGKALVLQALHSFRQMNLITGTLEVTEENRPAYLLYQRLGFRKMSTSYKEILHEDTYIQG